MDSFNDNEYGDEFKFIIKNHPTVAKNTSRADELKLGFIKSLKSLSKFADTEELEILYSYNGNFDMKEIVLNDIYVGITSLQIFKIENGNVRQIYITDIENASYQNNGFFSWDKVEMKLKNGVTNYFSIWSSKACQYFVSYLNMKINKK